MCRLGALGMAAALVLGPPPALGAADPSSIAALIASLERHFGAPCPVAAPALRVQMGGWAGDPNTAACRRQGLGGQLLRALGALSAAAAMNRSLRFGPEEDWVAVDRRGCPAGGLECFLRPLTSCPVTDFPVQWLACMHQNLFVLKSRLADDHDGNDFFGTAPAAAPADPQPLVAWQAALAHLLLRPQPWVQAGIAALQQKLDWAGRPSIGVHFRWGDRYTGLSPMGDVETFNTHFWPTIRQLLRQHPRARVYVATDSSRLAETLAAGWPDAAFAFRPALVSPDIVRDYWQQAPSYNRTEATFGVLADISLLSQADFLVGHHVSAVSKLAYLLRYARLGSAAAATTFWPRWAGDNPGGFRTYVFGSALDTPAFGRCALQASDEL